MTKSSDISFARAWLALNLHVLECGGPYPPRDVEVTLCEDNKTVTLLAPDGRGDWVGSTYELDAPTSEEDFEDYRRSLFD